MTGTTAGFLNAVSTPPIFGTPYSETDGGGVTPGVGLDCSGTVMVGAATQGVTIPRDTTEQWAAALAKQNMRVVANTPADPVLGGDLVYFYVPGDGGQAPQHVGIYIRPGWMIDAPHTGLTVCEQPIPYLPGIIWPFGYARIAFATVPPPPPPPPPIEETDMAAVDPGSGGIWVTDPTGAVFCFDGAPYLGGLNNHPEWHAGNAGDPVVGIVPWKGNGVNEGGNGYAIATRPTGSKAPDLYRFPRSGVYAKS